MKLLLDTHTFLWFVLGDSLLSTKARTLIEDTKNEKLISPAVYWEIAIKISLNKYTLTEPYESFMDRGINQNGFIILPVEPRHTAALTDLPYHHRDPFNRLIIAERNDLTTGRNRGPVVLDEVQLAPNIFPALKIEVESKD